MTCNVENMLKQAGRAAGNEYGYEFALNELAKNLKEFRDRWRAGDTTVADEFFTLYTFSDSRS